MSGGDVRSRSLYVGGLDEAVTVAVLKAAFLPFGEIKDVQIPLDMATQKNKGFGFVEFEEEEDAEAAMENMSESELYGRTLRVNKARALQGKAGKAVWAEADQWYAALKDAGQIDEGVSVSDAIAAMGGGGGAGAGAAAASRATGPAADSEKPAATTGPSRGPNR